MGFSFEQSGPGDSITSMTRPEGHAGQDEKIDKMGRSPWSLAGKFPTAAGLVSPEESPQGGTGHGDSGYSGGGR
jgi:hypothetical protein